MEGTDKRGTLRRSGDRMARLILESATDYAIIATDLDGFVVSWNTGAEQVLGWSEAQALGRDSCFIFTPEDNAAGACARELETARATGRAEDERWHLRADGSRFRGSGLMMRLEEESTGEHIGFLKILRDLTARQANEALVSSQHALFESENRYRTLFNSIDAGFCLIEMKFDDHGIAADYRFIEVNAAFERLTSIQHAPGRWMRDIAPLHEQHWFDLYGEVARTGAPARREDHAAALGRWFDVRAFRIDDPASLHVAVLFYDVSERKISEKALADARMESEAIAAQQAATLSQLAEGVIVTDATGRITLVNEAAARIHGVKRLDVAPDDYSETYHLMTEDGRPYPSLDLPLARAVRGDSVVDARWRIRRPDGSEVMAVGNARPILADDGGNQLGAVLTLRDETARIEAERELKNLNETLEAQVVERTHERDRLWALSEDLLVIADYEGALLRVSPSWTRLFGHSEEYLLSDHYAGLVHPEDFPAVAEALDRMRASGRPVHFENRILATDGAYRWIAWNLQPDPDGARLNGVGRDITDEKARQAELQAAQEQLRQAQKMEAVGQLTGGIAHDFNNLLTGVIGSLDMLQRRIAQGRTGDIERYVTAATTSANRAAALTHRLLAFSRRQPLDPKPVNANRLVTGMEELLRRTIGEAVRLEIVTAGGLWLTLCDPHQLESAILNLAINARDAMPGGGKLTIETCNAHLDNAYAASRRDVRPGQYVCICVTDTGSGMTPDIIAKAFDPFFTTKPIGQGTGLGLSMIYGFVRQSEGYVKIYSEPEQGATIKLYLPRYYGEGEIVEDREDGRDEQPAADHGEVVLVVEDETAVRDLVVELLQELGYRTVEAVDGPSGLALVQSKMRIDLMVSDIGLPGLNGRQLADAARLQRPDLKVLFMTGYAENAAIANGFLEPGMQMITKPFAMEALATRIRGMVEG